MYLKGQGHTLPFTMEVWDFAFIGVFGLYFFAHKTYVCCSKWICHLSHYELIILNKLEYMENQISYWDIEHILVKIVSGWIKILKICNWKYMKILIS